MTLRERATQLEAFKKDLLKVCKKHGLTIVPASYWTAGEDAADVLVVDTLENMGTEMIEWMEVSSGWGLE